MLNVVNCENMNNKNNCNSNGCNLNIKCNSNKCHTNCNNIERNCNNCDQNENAAEIIVEEEKVPILIPFPSPPQPQPHSSNLPTVINNNTYNHTAKININNVVNTVNNVSVPISVNTSNVNQISIYPANNGHVEVEDVFENKNCCVIIHPRQCDTSAKCYSRSSWECSDICTQDFIKPAEKG